MEKGLILVVTFSVFLWLHIGCDSGEKRKFKNFVPTEGFPMDIVKYQANGSYLLNLNGLFNNFELYGEGELTIIDDGYEIIFFNASGVIRLSKNESESCFAVEIDSKVNDLRILHLTKKVRDFDKINVFLFRKSYQSVEGIVFDTILFISESQGVIGSYFTYDSCYCIIAPKGDILENVIDYSEFEVMRLL